MSSQQAIGIQRRTPRKGPGRPAAGESLTPREVAEAALQLVVSEGEAALTMRRLGEVLGVKAMALYNHFRDKGAILDAVANLALARLPTPPAKGPWKSRIKAICHGIRSMALEHPNLFRVAMMRPTPPGSALPQIEAALSALADAGLAPAAQAVAYHTLRLYVRAFCLWEIEELRLFRAGDPAELARITAPFPHAAAVGGLIFTPDADRQFAAGLDLILRGLQTSR
ncbi:MAG: TetR/AcrR family transcriptional regulator C-terminal domain-containing protein [Phycisphaeraceae bacterium]|nr:TetR/AcrR family transcriptional regulator C-terminal domain-containing protein [Phycisphaeraceae bacterium]